MSIKIIVIDSTFKPYNGEYKNTIVLNYDNWNDYSYRTSFGMYYCDFNGEVIEIGFPKIYYWENDSERTEDYSMHTRTSLPREVVQLSDKYCSLGNNLVYYMNLKKALPNEYNDVLKRLNDIAIFDKIQEKFIQENGVKTSLLRFSDAEKALYEAKEVLIDDIVKEKDISFEYNISVPYDSQESKLVFDFSPTLDLPYRVNCLIGKNGTGKTQILSKLANSLSGFTDKQEESPFDNRPLIDKVMSISYSAFDPFRKPPENEKKVSRFSYVYCGIQNEKGTLSLNELKNNLLKSYEVVKNKNRVQVWENALSELLEAEHNQTFRLLINQMFEEVNLSSGQQILVCTLTEIISNIEDGSIILFDEPEIHLHPNAISNVMRMLNLILEEFKSYAIFTTHSPIIIQEIPSKYIQILDRIDDTLYVRKPSIECFGNNISEITSDVFDVGNKESNYKYHLDKLLKSKSVNEIIELFGGNLSMNAMIYLNSNNYMV